MNKLLCFFILPVLFPFFLNNNNQSVTGILFGESSLSAEEAYMNLKESLQQNEQINIMAELDHTENARSAGMELGTTKIIFFGNPKLGTPLMQKNQLAALDLPQRVLFYEQEEMVYAIYNSPEFLESRFALNGLESIDQISAALEKLVSAAIQNPISKSDTQSIDENEGVITVESVQDFKETYEKLKNSISQNEQLTIVAEVDHQKNAESVGMQLGPTKVILFGNPKMGTPLMKSSPTAGLDLPQKVLVWESEAGAVNISYNDPDFLKTRHQITDKDDEIQQIKSALEKLVAGTAKP